MTLEELAKWHDRQADKSPFTDISVRHLATAAALRELAYLQGFRDIIRMQGEDVCGIVDELAEKTDTDIERIKE